MDSIYLNKYSIKLKDFFLPPFLPSFISISIQSTSVVNEASSYEEIRLHTLLALGNGQVSC